MLKIIISCLLAVALNAFDYQLLPQKVAEGTYCFFGKLETITKQNAGNMVNTCYVQTKEGFVVIDSGPTYAYATQAYAAMQKISKLPVKYVINTHDHDDHWLGNNFYKEQGALLIGPRTYEQNIVSGMQTRMQSVLGNELFAKTKIVKLHTVVDHNLTLKVGERIFKIKQLEKVAHTKGDLIIYLPISKILFTGDLIFNGRLTSLRDGSVVGALKAIDKIDAYNASTIISGHGLQTDKDTTKQFKTYLLDLKTEVLKALDADIGMENVTKHIKMSKYKDMKLYDILQGRNVLDVYGELEMMEDEE